MRAQKLNALLIDALQKSGAHQDYRGYLGMSGIGGCPREQYWRAVDPQPADFRMRWYGWTGYLHEAGIKGLLGAHREAVLTFLGGALPVGRELVARFDPRYRGHTDLELPDGTLVEIKSVGWEKFLRLQAQGQPESRHLAQIQAYMRHGEYPHAIAVYVARDVPHAEWEKMRGSPLPLWCADVYRDRALMDALDAKALNILAAMDRDEPPECECGRCQR